MRWCETSSQGVLFTYSVIVKSEVTGAGAPAPYTVAYVETDGARLLSNLRHGSAMPNIGDIVWLDYVVSQGRTFPIFVSSDIRASTP